MKQLPKLKLVSRDGGEASAETGAHKGRGRLGGTFELIGLDAVSPEDRARLQMGVQEILPKAAILGVARTARPWDLRPVVAYAGDESPSIIRFIGPDVFSQTHLAARVRDAFERFKSQSELSSSVLGCGLLRGEFWYRRTLVESTLGHQLSASQGLTEQQVFNIASALVEEVSRWHQRGFIHAHITSSNVCVNADGGVSLLDSTIGFATIQATKGRTDYNLQSFAPELLAGDSPAFSADIYGLGLIYRRLFLGLAKRAPYENDKAKLDRVVRPFLELSEALLQQDPNQRPGLPQIRRFIEDGLNTIEKQAGADSRERKKVESSFKKGRIIRTPSTDSAPVQEPVLSADHPTAAEAIPVSAASGKPASSAQKISIEAAPTAEDASRQIPLERRAPGAGNVQAAAQHVPPPQQSSGVVFESVPVPPYAQPGVPPFAGYAGQPFPQQAMPYPYAQPQAPHPQHGFHPQQPVYAYGHPYGPYPAQQVPGQGIYAGQHPQIIGAGPGGVPIYQNHPIGAPHMGAVPPGMFHPGPMQGPPLLGTPPQIQPEQKKESNLFLLGFILTLSLVAFWFYRTRELLPDTTPEQPVIGEVQNLSQLKEAWGSKMPSRMIPVAELALSQNEFTTAAQSLIIESAVRGDEGLLGINVPLLRVAFDGAWESKLTPQDRRSAIAMGVAGLLRDKLPKDLQNINGLHPGVILAATASAGKTASRILSGVPASMLAQLVPPFGPAFQELIKDDPNLTCGDDAVQRLARLGTRGAIDGLDDITLFLKTEEGAVRTDADRRLRAMASLFSYNNSLANSILQVILKHPNLSIDIPSIKWAKDWDLLNWKELEPGDRLFVLAGVAPAGVVSADNLGKLFAHPSAPIRSFAIGKALDRIKLGHPGAFDVFRMIQNDPAILTPKQTVELAHLLERPEALQMPAIQTWLSSKPPMQVVISLLVSTASQTTATPLDRALAIYLKETLWKPDLGTLRKISSHPDFYTRLFAYNELYTMEDRETSRELLASSLRKEDNEDNRTRLQHMLKELSGD